MEFDNATECIYCHKTFDKNIDVHENNMDKNDELKEQDNTDLKKYTINNFPLCSVDINKIISLLKAKSIIGINNKITLSKESSSTSTLYPLPLTKTDVANLKKCKSIQYCLSEEKLKVLKLNENSYSIKTKTIKSNERPKIFKVKDHDHFTGKYRGAACNKCNTQEGKSTKIIPFLFHNGKGYDFHHFVNGVQNLQMIIVLLNHKQKH